MIKILYYFPDYGDHMSEWQYIHFIDELKYHNVSFEILNPLYYETYEQANEAIVKRLRDCKFDVFMTCCGTKKLFASTLKEIKKLSIPSLLFCVDNLHDPYTHKEIMPYFDLVWLSSWETETMIRKWGANTIFLPYGANPYTFNATHKDEEILSVGFVGTPYGTRPNKFNELIKHEISCSVYYGGAHDVKKSFPLQEQSSSKFEILRLLKESLSFPVGRKVLLGRFLAIFNETRLIENTPYLSHHPSLSFNDMIEHYSRFALSLNITELRNTYLLKNPVHKVHLRSFEIPMSGGLQYTTYSDELASYFEEDKEIVFYHDKDEFVDKARFYLSDSQKEKRQRMKAAARKRCEMQHCWWNRFEILFKELCIKNS